MSDSALPPEQATEIPDDVGAPAQTTVQPTVDFVPATVDKMLSMQLAGLRINKRPLSEALTTLSLVAKCLSWLTWMH